MKTPKIAKIAPMEKAMPTDDYETKNHFDTLMRAEEIKNDPAKMKKVRRLLPLHKRAIKSIQDIRDAANDMDKMNGLKDDDMGDPTKY